MIEYICLETHKKDRFTYHKDIIYNLYYNDYSKDSIDKKVKDGLLMPYRMYMRDKKMDEILNN
jgi:hypothetical protein